ncbi:MAG TPA: hypothetical protein DCE42_07925 [Myxococcales bacterium]|nr:hypothetical protein [Myxococcales bacterium]
MILVLKENLAAADIQTRSITKHNITKAIIKRIHTQIKPIAVTLVLKERAVSVKTSPIHLAFPPMYTQNLNLEIQDLAKHTENTDVATEV